MPDSIAAIATTIPTSPAIYWPQFSLQTPLPNWVFVASSASPWYLDALKAGVGSLFGALIAFIFAIWHRRMQEKNANLRAGNLALFKLRAIHRRTGELRRWVRQTIVDQRQAMPTAPDWALLKPVLVSMEDIEAFNLSDLSFLLDRESGREAINKVAHAEYLRCALVELLSQHQDTAFEFQKTHWELLRTNGGATWDDVERHAGKELVGRRSSFFRAFLQQVEQNPPILRECFAALEGAMKEKFRKDVWKLEVDFAITSSRWEGKLPPLPDDIAETLASMPS